MKWFPALRRGDWARAADAPRRHAALPDERYSLPGCSAPGLKVLAARDIRMGEVVFSDAGILRRWPDQHTIQIGKQSHFELHGDSCFASHSFAPSCYCRILRFAERPVDLVALRDLEEGEEITWNYCTTEWALVGDGFTDLDTRKAVRGFSHLSDGEKYELMATGTLSAHILSLWVRLLRFEAHNISDLSNEEILAH